jgi:hypothetical protein
MRPPAMRLLLILCGVLAGSATAAVDGECPRVIGVASTPGRPDLFKSFIGGEWRTSSSGKTLKVLSPCNETMLYEVQVPAGTAPCVRSPVSHPVLGLSPGSCSRAQQDQAPGLAADAPRRAGVHAGRDRRGIRGCKKGAETVEQDAPVRPCLFLSTHAFFRGFFCDLYTPRRASFPSSTVCGPVCVPMPRWPAGAWTAAAVSSCAAAAAAPR